MDNSTIGLFMFGIAIGLFMPGFPAPLNFVSHALLGVILLIVGVILFLKK